MAMELVVDDHHLGTDERTWFDGNRLAELPSLRERRPRRLVVVSPHPDDEILGAGGLLQQAAHDGVDIVLVAVTDGEASHPGVSTPQDNLATRRVEERRMALDRLGCASAHVQRLCLPDGSLAERGRHLTDRLIRLLEPDDLCVAPWRSDGHPDHDATGRAAVTAARLTHTRVIEYLVWAWHWAAPDDVRIPWHLCRRFDLGRPQMARKRWATYAFTSQIRPLGHDLGGRPVLPDPVLRRFWRSFEVFIETQP
jgi:LmbE family N-acetylglucosaminyl deacetylase